MVTSVASIVCGDGTISTLRALDKAALQLKRGCFRFPELPRKNVFGWHCIAATVR